MRQTMSKVLKKTSVLALFACLIVTACVIARPTTVKATPAPGPAVTSDPSKLELNTEYVVEASKAFHNYYYFTITEDTRVQVISTGTSEYSLYVQDSTNGTSINEGRKVSSVNNAISTNDVFKAGDYYLITGGRDVAITLTIKTTPYVWGTATLDSFDKGTFSISYTPGAEAEDADTYLDSFTFTNHADFISGKLKTATISVDDFNGYAGHNKLTVTVKNDKLDLRKTYEFDAVQKPDTPKYNADMLKNVTTTTAVIGSSTSSGSPINLMTDGNYYRVELYHGGQWTNAGTYAGTGQAKLTGLKANTDYKVRLVGILRTEGYADIESAPSNEVKFTTGCKKKPAIKSIKVSNVKTKKIPKVWHAGHWIGSTWSAGYYTGGYTETSFKITVTLKSREKGPKGLNIDGVYVKGSGKTFTTKATRRGNLKGKKVNLSISYANHKTYGGLSPATKKKVKF